MPEEKIVVRVAVDDRGRSTKGRNYIMRGLKITDDSGELMKPCMRKCRPNLYWLTKEEWNLYKLPKLKTFWRCKVDSFANYTKGGIYIESRDGRVFDDHGSPGILPVRSKTWNRCKAMTHEEAFELLNNPDAMKEQKSESVARDLALTKNLTHEETEMPLKIEEVTLVNGKRVDEMNQSELISLIKKEENEIDSLGSIKTNLPGVSKLKAKHQSNIDKLGSVLEEIIQAEESDD